jgi:hypothetical protein
MASILPFLNTCIESSSKEKISCGDNFWLFEKYFSIKKDTISPQFLAGSICIMDLLCLYSTLITF